MSSNNFPRMHKHLVLSVLSILRSSFEEGYYIDKVIEREFKANRKWGARDRRFVAESSFEMVRWWQSLWKATEFEVAFDDQSLLYLFGTWWRIQARDLPSWEEFQGFDYEKAVSRFEKLKAADKASLPQWIFDKISAELDASDVDKALEALNQQANVVLRVNRIKATKEQLIEKLSEEGVESYTDANYPDAVVLTERKNVFRTEAFKKGMFEVQDGASQSVGRIMDLEPGMRVIDACAGAGGKTLQIASLMENKGTVISLDIHAHKLEALKKRARRAGVSIVDTRAIESTKVVKRLASSADRLLLDVPCSGLGVLRRNPDTKWKLNQERLSELVDIQADILNRYSKMLKPGAKMVYATCSVLTEENEAQVENFLKQHPEWSLISQERHWPHLQGYDGFYTAVLQRLS